ncbi:sensor histidine kinase [Actinorhabdospora filicis]|uniref:sensor histidine kinase n=1 Tax=Actinorhabdospora filicis TaxID=1785913 RepID=UPI002556F270|nr:nitrate- and nitrite sensing domain-containing protein [Actinorhabdospora filicis]
MTVPLATAVAFAALAVATTVGDALQAHRLRTLVVAADAVGDLSHRLQIERTAAVEGLAHQELGTDPFLASARDTDVAVKKYADARDRLGEFGPNLTSLLDRMDRQLKDLPRLRRQVSGGAMTASATAFRYRILLGDLVTYRESIVQNGGARGDNADRIRAAAALAQAAEYAGAEQITVDRAIESGRLTPAAQQEITAARSGYLESMRTFETLSGAGWLARYQAEMSQDAVTVQVLEDAVSRVRPGRAIKIDDEAWIEAMDKRLAHIDAVQSTVDADVVKAISDLRTTERVWGGLQAGLVLIAVIVALWLAVRLGRPVVLGLRRLRDAADRVASADLPMAVAKLNSGDGLGDLTPDQFAGRNTKLLPAKGSDELAEVARAFNAVHTEAVRVAAEQAVLRLHIARMFVELARRGNSLTGRLTRALDAAQHTEEDPEALDRLFAFDHMVTLLSRRNNSLLVLGGSSPAHARVNDEPVADVLKAAQGQVEHYKRVHIGEIAEGMAVKAKLIDEMVILLAELIDNATRFSQHVLVSASALADRTIIQISDDGIGIEPPQREALNARLAYPKLDLDSLHSMGMTVVGTIAERHGITVELRGGPDGGTIAEVTVPAAILVKEEPREAAPDAPAEPATASGPAAPLFQRRDEGHAGIRRDMLPERPAPEPQMVAEEIPALFAPEPPPEPEPIVDGHSLPLDEFIAEATGTPIATEAPVATETPVPEAAAAPVEEPETAEPFEEPETLAHPVHEPEPLDSRWPIEPAAPVADGYSRPLDAPLVKPSPLPLTQRVPTARLPVEDETPTEVIPVITDDMPDPRGHDALPVLPRRAPMAHLVPGGMPATAEAPVSDYRDPASVGATFAAYKRGTSSTNTTLSMTTDREQDSDRA